MSKSLHIGFIQAKHDIDVDWFRPLSFGYLKAYLEKYLDESVEMHFLDNLESIGNLNIIGITATSQDFGVARNLAAKIKKNNPDIITVLGGHHITYLPETLPKDVDFGVIGEGEQTFLELIRFLINNLTTWTPKKIQEIKGLVYHVGGSFQITPPRDLIEPLDHIPAPYRKKGVKTYLFSSRGCPFKCSFCSSSAFWKKTRFFSAEYVVNEIETIYDLSGEGFQHIAVWDDLFIANKSRLIEIANLLEERGLNQQISFDFSLRANLVDETLCGILKRMNVKAVGIGFESGSDKILKLLNKGVTVDTNQKAIDILHHHGFLVGGSFIVGCPTETETEVRSTYEFALKNIKAGKLSPHCAVNILSPMPGTRIWQHALEKGVVDLKQIDWNRLAMFASYRNSTISDFEEWLQLRRNVKPFYLAEDTLPIEKLYAIMSYYENILAGFDNTEKKFTKGPFQMNNEQELNWFFKKGTLRRKIIKALYLLLTDISKFKKHLLSFYGQKKKLKNVSVEQQKAENRFPFPESRIAHKYCIGKGLEVGGSAHNPFGLDTLNVDYTDSMDTEFKRGEVELCGHALKVDIVANGDAVPLPDESQDFVVSSHVIEHFPNPIKALLEWDRLVKPGGVILMIVPHKERTFDKDKVCTTLEHIIEDYQNNNTEPHDDPNGHDHCWVTETFVELINYMINNMQMKWKIEVVQDVDDKVGNGFTVVLRKVGTYVRR